MRKMVLSLGLLLTTVSCSRLQNPSGDFEIASLGGMSANLGVQYTDSAGAPGTSHLTFRVYSSKAQRIELNLFAKATGENEKLKYVLTKNPANSVWSVTVPVASLRGAGIDTVYYGYRAWGPNWTYKSTWKKGSDAGWIKDVDAEGNRFNPNKLLIDPYALEISHDPTSTLSGNYTWDVYKTGPTERALDSGKVAPKGMVIQPILGLIGTKPTRALKDDVVYEVHLRGLTRADASLTCAGTYAGAAKKAEELKQLGVTVVEFLPVQETDNESNDVDDVASKHSSTDGVGDNYWGYMTTNYFAPDRRYACDQSPGGPTREFQQMTKAFHDQGIKVWIDVVYNHTAEGGIWKTSDTTALISWRGLDSLTYDSLTKDRQYFWDNTGVGANMNTFNPVTQNLIVDSLKYWRDVLGVDGFRFDLASILGNTQEHDGFFFSSTNSNTALARIAREIPARPAAGGVGTDLIAEPWGIGDGTYQVGNFPKDWAEWNGKYRDVIRKDQNRLGVDDITPGQLADRFAGSSDLYQDDGRKPWNSINFLIAHDGLTLKDVYSCNGKNNTQAWPYGASDGGSNSNDSWDHANVAVDQRQAARTGMALLMLSAGVPMITGGDEYLRSMKCNNNPYNLDSSANWLNGPKTTEERNFKTFTQKMMAFRSAHPSLRPSDFYSDKDNNGNVMEQLRWFKPDGNVPDATYFADKNNHALAFRIDATEFGEVGTQAIYIAYNGWQDKIDFKLPWPATGKQWYRVTDTCSWAEGSSQVDLTAAVAIGGEHTTYNVCGRGLIVLIAK
ncbi:MAG: isoamylase [Deinococcaceae bacterium]